MELPYIDGFDDQADVLRAFREPSHALDGAELLFVEYKNENYSAHATIVYRKDGELFLVSGSHCSCHGLEGQWSPEPMTAEAMKMFKGSKPWREFVDQLNA